MTEDEPEGPFGNNPGKKQITGPNGRHIATDNMDIRNAMYLRIIEGLESRVSDLAEEIQTNMDREADTQVDVPLGRVGTGVFEIHVISQSFFESASWVLLQWAIKADVPVVNDLIQYFEEEHRDSIFESDDTRESKVSAIKDYLDKDGSSFDYISILYFSGVIDSEFKDLLHSVRMRRNEYVHDPLLLIQLLDAKTVISQVSECVSTTERMTEIVESELPIERAFYDIYSGE